VKSEFGGLPIFGNEESLSEFLAVLGNTALYGSPQTFFKYREDAFYAEFAGLLGEAMASLHPEQGNALAFITNQAGQEFAKEYQKLNHSQIPESENEREGEVETDKEVVMAFSKENQLATMERERARRSEEVRDQGHGSFIAGWEEREQPILEGGRELDNVWEEMEKEEGLPASSKLLNKGENESQLLRQGRLEEEGREEEDIEEERGETGEEGGEDMKRLQNVIEERVKGFNRNVKPTDSDTRDRGSNNVNVREKREARETKEAGGTGRQVEPWERWAGIMSEETGWSEEASESSGGGSRVTENSKKERRERENIYLYPMKKVRFYEFPFLRISQIFYSRFRILKCRNPSTYFL
jgi:hypothetical protein